MKSSEQFKSLESGSLRVYSHRQTAKVDGEGENRERSYLEFDGTPEAYRFLAALLTEMADIADRYGKPGRGQSVLLDPSDTDGVSIDGFDALSLSCRKRIPGSGTLNL